MYCTWTLFAGVQVCSYVSHAVCIQVFFFAFLRAACSPIMTLTCIVWELTTYSFQWTVHTGPGLQITRGMDHRPLITKVIWQAESLHWDKCVSGVTSIWTSDYLLLVYPLLNLLPKFLNKGQWVTDISKMKFQRIQELVNYELEYLAVCQFRSLAFVGTCWNWSNPCFWSFLHPEGAPNYFPNSFTGPLDDLRHSPHTVKVSVDSQKSILMFF